MRALAPLVVFALALAGALSVPSAAAQEPLASTTISGADLPHSIRIAAVDHDAFMRRLDLPPLLDDEPAVRGKAYTVTSPYWDVGVRAGDKTQPLVDEAATYYPDGGFVKTRQGTEVVWTAVDAIQKAILDRYIRLAPSLSEAPAIFEVLRAAGLANEQIGISIGEVEMTPEQRAKFWQLAGDVALRIVPAPANQEPLDLSKPADGLTWVIFNLPEGRAVPMIYSNLAGTFAELGESRQGRLFPVPRDWLVPVLGDEARFGPSNNALAPVEIPQQEGQGAPIWWLITLGSGLIAIAAAILLQRRLTHA